MLSPTPWPNVDSAYIQTSDRRIKVGMVLQFPAAVLLEDFLSEEECDLLIQQATPKLERSTAIDRDSGAAMVFDSRTSDGMFFRVAETELIHRIERRIAEAVNWPVEKGEGLQVLRYGIGGEFKPHVDYFDPALSGSAIHIANGGQRVATLLMYLETPLEGGHTSFPDAKIKVPAQKGNALLFVYSKPHPAAMSLHAGDPIIKGQKHVATKWFREQVYK